MPSVALVGTSTGPMLFHLRSGGGAVGMLVPSVVGGHWLVCGCAAVRVLVLDMVMMSTIAMVTVTARAAATVIRRERLVNICFAPSREELDDRAGGRDQHAGSQHVAETREVLAAHAAVMLDRHHRGDDRDAHHARAGRGPRDDVHQQVDPA